MGTINKTNRHKWAKDERGKKCIICGSRINDNLGSKYIEVDVWGIAESVDWYPRCNPKKQIKNK
jgi:hypothetical protein